MPSTSAAASAPNSRARRQFLKRQIKKCKRHIIHRRLLGIAGKHQQHGSGGNPHKPVPGIGKRVEAAHDKEEKKHVDPADIIPRAVNLVEAYKKTAGQQRRCPCALFPSDAAVEKTRMPARLMTETSRSSGKLTVPAILNTAAIT